MAVVDKLLLHFWYMKSNSNSTTDGLFRQAQGSLEPEIKLGLDASGNFQTIIYYNPVFLGLWLNLRSKCSKLAQLEDLHLGIIYLLL